MLALAKEKAAEAGVELELREGDMRDFTLDEPAALVYCPFRAMLHLPTWSDKRRVFERVAARAALPAGRFVWNSFVFNPRIAAANDGHVGRAARHPPPRRPLPRGQPARHHARVGRQRPRSGGSRRASGKGWSTSRASMVEALYGDFRSARRSTSRAASSSGSRGSRGEGRACTTRSPSSTTRGAGASSRTWASTSRRREVGRDKWSSSGSARAGSRSRSPRPASA